MSTPKAPLRRSRTALKDSSRDVALIDEGSGDFDAT